jgi:hypothetical protein
VLVEILEPPGLLEMLADREPFGPATAGRRYMSPEVVAARLGEKAVPSLIRILRNEGDDARERVLNVPLWPRGSRPPVLPEIIDELGASAAEALPRLLRVLAPVVEGDETEPEATLVAVATSLGLIGPAAPEALPILEDLMGEADRMLAPHAALAVFRISGDSALPLRMLDDQGCVALARGRDAVPPSDGSPGDSNDARLVSPGRRTAGTA